MATRISPESVLLTDRVVVVTGAAQGIGRATALAAAALGAKVAICDRLEDGLAETSSDLGDALICAAHIDVRDADLVERFASDVEVGAGRIDALVNNAGGGFHSAFVDVSPKGEAALIAENFTQVTSCTRAFLPLFGDGGGSITNVSSIEAHRAGPGFGIYSAMKAAVENLTKTLAMELSDRRIRVNSVAPDMIPTPGDAGLAEIVSAAGGGGYTQPLPDDGSPDDVAGVIVFLMSDLARFVTGTTLHVDGGTHAASGWRRGAGGTWIL